MRAVRVVSLDGPDGLEVGEVPEPEAAPDQVAIEVAAAGVTYPDVLLSRGRYQLKPALPFIPGSQVAGTVVSAPSGAGLSIGDRVCAWTMNGGYAENLAVDPSAVFRLPDTLTWEAGAVALTNYLTAHFVLLRRGRPTSGETVLVHGAAGGVGLASIQVAKSFGARVLAVVSSSDKASAARRSGADEVMDVGGFRESVRDATDGRGVDVIVDPVGGERFTDSLRSLAPSGRLVVVGFVGGEIPTVRVNRLLLNNIDVVGAAWGAYALSNPGYAQEQWDDLFPGFVSGALHPEIGGVLPLEEAGEALRLLENREVVGNVVLRVR